MSEEKGNQPTMIPPPPEITPVVEAVDDSSAIVDDVKLRREEVFIGQYPFATILESIEAQFNDYINCEDRTNYIEIFYDQLSKSATNVETDPRLTEENKEDMKDALEEIFDDFKEFIVEIIERRLGLSIMDLAEDQVSDGDFQWIIMRIYEFFILAAKKNFKVVIGDRVAKRIGPSITKTDDQAEKDKQFLMIQDMMEEFNPHIRTVDPVEFLNITGDVEMLNMFSNHKVVGNFLLKYTPKLAYNAEYRGEIINYISDKLILSRALLEQANPEGNEVKDVDPLAKQNNEEE